MTVEQVFKSLADTTRLRIAVLLAQGELCVCDLMQILDLPKSTISRHMAYLRAAGVVKARRAGKWVHYRLEDNRLPGEIRRLLARSLAKKQPHRSDIRKCNKRLATKCSGR